MSLNVSEKNWLRLDKDVRDMSAANIDE